nr:MAG TPA: hypothetical protein [Caudoviricetes sp.]
MRCPCPHDDMDGAPAQVRRRAPPSRHYGAQVTRAVG